MVKRGVRVLEERCGDDAGEIGRRQRQPWDAIAALKGTTARTHSHDSQHIALLIVLDTSYTPCRLLMASAESFAEALL